MKKVLVALFVLVVASAGIAFAGPQTMNDTQMDKIVAGERMIMAYYAADGETPLYFFSISAKPNAAGEYPQYAQEDFEYPEEFYDADGNLLPEYVGGYVDTYELTELKGRALRTYINTLFVTPGF